MMGAIRKTEQERFAYLLNVLVSLPPPPTRPVDCMNYFSICNKQLGNYYCYNQINNSCCDVATTWQNLWTDFKGKKDLFMDLVLLGWAALVSFSLFSSGSMFYVFLLLSTFFLVSLYSCLLHSSLSCVPVKDIHERRAGMVETVWACLNGCPAITLCFYASVFLLLLFLSDLVWVEISSLVQSDWICILYVCVWDPFFPAFLGNNFWG